MSQLFEVEVKLRLGRLEAVMHQFQILDIARMILAMSPTNPEQQRPKIATFVFGTPWLIFLLS